MQDYKNYIMPGVALVMVLAWFFIVAPMLDDETTSDEATGGELQAEPSEPRGAEQLPTPSPADQ